jgi:branched-chain amino acid transport system substrate-binding protein
MIKAIESANSLDRQKITDSLAKVTVTGITGITGKIAFDPYGDLIKPPYTLFQVQQGQWKSLRTVGGSGA